MKLVHFPEQPPVTTCRGIPGKYFKTTLIQIFIVFVFMMNFAIGDAICVGLSTKAKRAGLIGFVLQQLALFCKVSCYFALLYITLHSLYFVLFCIGYVLQRCQYFLDFVINALCVLHAILKQLFLTTCKNISERTENPPFSLFWE